MSKKASGKNAESPKTDEKIEMSRNWWKKLNCREIDGKIQNFEKKTVKINQKYKKNQNMAKTISKSDSQKIERKFARTW